MKKHWDKHKVSTIMKCFLKANILKPGGGHSRNMIGAMQVAPMCIDRDVEDLATMLCQLAMNTTPATYSRHIGRVLTNNLFMERGSRQKWRIF